MADLPNFTSIGSDHVSRVTHLVVLDHPERTEVFGTGADGTPLTRPFVSPGNLPWGAVLGLALEHSPWHCGEPGVEDVDPELGVRRYTFPAMRR